MKKKIILLGEEVEYELKKSTRIRYVRLTLYPGGTITMTVPWRYSESKAEIVMRQKARWVLDTRDRFKHLPKNILAQGSKKDFLYYKASAYSLVYTRVKHVNAFYQFAFKKISIKNQTTRWGSCSRKGNLNFNYRIVLLPPELADYLVVHELCHLKEMNHSARFWRLVAQTIPDYKQIRRKLRSI